MHAAIAVPWQRIHDLDPRVRPRPGERALRRGEVPGHGRRRHPPSAGRRGAREGQAQGKTHDRVPEGGPAIAAHPHRDHRLHGAPHQGRGADLGRHRYGALAHDRRGTQTRAAQKDNTRPPDVLLRALGVRDDRAQSLTVAGRYSEGDSAAREELRRAGVRVLSRRNLESYLFDDEVLRLLTVSLGKNDKAEALLSKKSEIRAARTGDAADDLKPVSGEIYLACKEVLEMSDPGNDAKTFMRDTMAPLIKPGTKAYDELKRDIFREERSGRAVGKSGPEERGNCP